MSAKVAVRGGRREYLGCAGGSGTAIIAAEQTRRRCYALELAPQFVDVAVLRWQRYSGEEATLAGDGRSYAEVAAARSPEGSALTQRSE